MSGRGPGRPGAPRIAAPRRAAAPLGAALALLPGLALAHLLPAQNVTLNVVGQSIYAVASVPVSALAGVDDDGDGRAAASEIARHDGEIRAQVEAGLRVFADGERGRPAMTWVLDPASGSDAGPAAYVVAMQRLDFVRPPASLTVASDLLGSGAGEGRVTVRATRGSATDIAILDTPGESRTLLRDAWTTFADFVHAGVVHILGGWDHLLFLLTSVAAVASWRLRACVVTSFTVAHSITLTLAALGVVRLSPAIVEPAILGTILVTALLALRGRGGSAAGHVGLVFGCGLLHGLGFASALDELGVAGDHRIATLAGFNAGVELGQLAALAVALPVLVALRRMLPSSRAALASAPGAGGKSTAP